MLRGRPGGDGGRPRQSRGGEGRGQPARNLRLTRQARRSQEGRRGHQTGSTENEINSVRLVLLWYHQGGDAPCVEPQTCDIDIYEQSMAYTILG